MIVRELAVKLGMQLDAASFAKGTLALGGLVFVAQKVAQAIEGAVDSFKEHTKEVVEWGVQIQRAAQKTGIGTEQLQKLGSVAFEEGVGLEKFGYSLSFLSRQMLQTQQGGKKAAEIFKLLGVKATDSQGKLRPVNDVLLDVADVFEKMPDGAEKGALAMRLFGRAGAQMIPILNKGREALEEFSDTSVLTDEQIKGLKDVDVQMKRLSLIAKALYRDALVQLLPVIKDLVKWWVQWKKENYEVAKARLVQFYSALLKIITVVGLTIKWLARNMDLLGYVLIALAGHWVLLTGAAQVFALLLGNAVPLTRTLTMALTALKAVLITGLAVGLALVIDDIRTYLKYGDEAETFTKDFIDKTKEWRKPNPNDPWWLAAIKLLCVKLAEAIKLLRELQSLQEKDVAKANSRKVNQFSPEFKRLRAQQPMTAEEALAAQREKAAETEELSEFNKRSSTFAVVKSFGNDILRQLGKNFGGGETDFKTTQQMINERRGELSLPTNPETVGATTNNTKVEINITAPTGDADQIAAAVNEVLGNHFSDAANAAPVVNR